MSAVLGGLGAVSRAMTKMPAFFAWFSEALTASPLVVIRMPLSAREVLVEAPLLLDEPQAAAARSRPAVTAADAARRPLVRRVLDIRSPFLGPHGPETRK